MIHIIFIKQHALVSTYVCKSVASKYMHIHAICLCICIYAYKCVCIIYACIYTIKVQLILSNARCYITMIQLTCVVTVSQIYVYTETLNEGMHDSYGWLHNEESMH